MEFIIAIEPGTKNTVFGVVVPDLPGCFTVGDTLDEAIDKAREVIGWWYEELIKDGVELPTAKTLAEHQANPDFMGWIWKVVDVPEIKGKATNL
jgi:predicted RNase H-like HicB family nuclease